MTEPALATAKTPPRPSREPPAGAPRLPPAQRGSDPISRAARLWSGQNGNSAPAKFIRQLRAALLAHVGGRPSATQRIAIERAVMLAFHIARMDAAAIEAGDMSEHARKQYLAWDGSLRRALAGLGMKPAPASPLTLSDYLAVTPRPPAAPAPAPAAPRPVQHAAPQPGAAGRGGAIGSLR